MNWVFDARKPVFISELGGGALYGRHGSRKERFTEEYQEDLYIRHVNMLKRIPGLAGTTPWILKDFRSPRRHVPEIQDDFNRKGLVSDKGQKKKLSLFCRNGTENWKRVINRICPIHIKKEAVFIMKIWRQSLFIFYISSVYSGMYSTKASIAS